MKKLSTKGFTLIELLVVITIIGILATGATAVYTSAQQKARDSIRQNDVLAVRSAVEQSFGDNAKYPTTPKIKAATVGAGYMQSLPSDPKTTQIDNQTSFEYSYAASLDEATLVQGQEYEISANFENTGNATSKEANAADGGDDPNRWEIGVNMDHVKTIQPAAAWSAVANNYGGTNSANDGVSVKIFRAATS